MSDADPTARSAALDAAIRLAVEAVTDGSSWRHSADIETAEVIEAADREISERTARRACKDAVALGWLTDERQGWDPGPRAEDHAPDTADDSRVTVCEDCTEVFDGLTTYCRECDSESIRQVTPRATE